MTLLSKHCHQMRKCLLLYRSVPLPAVIRLTDAARFFPAGAACGIY